MKKHILFLSISTILMFSCGKNDFSCYPEELKADIIASYTFTNGSVEDITGKGNDMDTVIGANLSQGRSGKQNCSYEFDYGESHYQKILKKDADFLNDMESFSISLWLQLTKQRSGTDFEVLISRDTFGTCPDRAGQWSVSLYDCRRAVFGHNNSVWVNWLSPNILDCSGTVPDILPTNWINIIAIKKNNSFSIYLNGNLENTVENNATCSSNPNFLSVDEGPLVFGHQYSGKIDDIIIFNRALTMEEVSLISSLESCCN